MGGHYNIIMAHAQRKSIYLVKNESIYMPFIVVLHVHTCVLHIY